MIENLNSRTFQSFRHRAPVPRAGVLVEGVGAVKHLVHVRHRARGPVADVLVEGGGVLEHALHGRHRARVPWIICCSI